MQTTKTSCLSEWRYHRKMFPVNGYFQTGAVSWLRDQVRASKHVSESNDRQIRTSWCSRLVQPPSPVRPTGPTRSAILENQRTRHLLLLCLLQTRTHAHTQIDRVTRHRRSYSSRCGRRAASLTLHPSIPITRYSLAAFLPLVSPAYPRERSKLPKYLAYVSNGASNLHRPIFLFLRVYRHLASLFRPYSIQISIDTIEDHT